MEPACRRHRLGAGPRGRRKYASPRVPSFACRSSLACLPDCPRHRRRACPRHGIAGLIATWIPAQPALSLDALRLLRESEVFFAPVAGDALPRPYDDVRENNESRPPSEDGFFFGCSPPAN